MELLKKETLRIAICDDNTLSLDYLRQMTEQVLSRKWELDIFCTHSPEALLEQTTPVQIALLDIQLPEQSGIELAKKILKKNPDCCIIFVSAYVQYVSDVYDVPHLCMVLKDQTDLQLPKYLLRAAEAIRKHMTRLTIRSNGAEHTLDMESVGFLERRGHITYVNLKNGMQLQTREKLDMLLRNIDCRDVCRCHVSFVVNMTWIASMQENEFVMQNGSIIPISRINKQIVKKQYFDHLKSKL